MNSTRLNAFRHAEAIIDTMSAAKLHPREEEALRDAAEGLLLEPDPESIDARLLRILASWHLDELVANGRWMSETADELRGAIEACCPLPVAA
jgi:hypothetical protein